MKAVFLDRDGTVIHETPVDETITPIEDIKLFPDTIEALKTFADADMAIIFITNQGGIARENMAMSDFTQINQHLLDLL